jgi:hypothetical protein
MGAYFFHGTLRQFSTCANFRLMALATFAASVEALGKIDARKG